MTQAERRIYLIQRILDEQPRYQNIKVLRSELGLSQKKFSEMLGVNRSTVSIWKVELHRPSRQNYQNMIAIKTQKEASA